MNEDTQNLTDEQPTPIFTGPQLDWASAIGLFIINFGMLDWLMLEFLERNLGPEEFAKVKHQHFQDRLSKVKGLACDPNQPPEWKAFFARLDSIRKLRNHIAHGHFLARMDEKGNVVMTLSLPKNLDVAHEPETRHVTFREMEVAHRQLKEVIEEFRALTE
jgi:hypothetical protein